MSLATLVVTLSLSCSNGIHLRSGQDILLAMITVTDGAADKIKGLLDKEENPQKGLRVAVKGGGCSGFQYELGFDELRSDDRVIDQHGLKVFLDPRSILYLAGSTLDYNDGLMESGFKIENPNANSTCGCGESFSV